MKANPWKLIQAHYRTLRDANTGDARPWDYALFLGLPALVYVLCLFLGTELPVEAAAGLLTATGVLSAFFFGVVLQVAQKAMDLADNPPKESGKATYWQIEFLKEIAASAGYACLVSVVAAAVFLASLMATSKWVVVVFSSLGIALGVHLVLLLSMVLSRVYDLIIRRLRTAKVGGAKGRGTVHPIDARRTGSDK
jgi:hypothetical protein